MEDIASQYDFEFAVGDSIYVTESTHKLLCYNKHTNKASIKPLKTGQYIVAGICFGDAIDHLHDTIERYNFDNEYDRQEAHARIYSFRIRNTLTSSYLDYHSPIFKRIEYNGRLCEVVEREEMVLPYCICSDTTYNDKKVDNIDTVVSIYDPNELVSFYQNENGEFFVQLMNKFIKDEKAKKEYYEKNKLDGKLSKYAQFFYHDIEPKAIVYKIENENGDLFYVDQREIWPIKVGRHYDKYKKEDYFFLKSIEAKKIPVLKISDYNRIKVNLVGKEYYLFNARGYLGLVGYKDYITKKEVKLNDSFGELIEAAEMNYFSRRVYNENEEDMGGINDYYQCKDLVIRNGEYVIIFSNASGEFSAFLESQHDKFQSSFQRHGNGEYCFNYGCIEIVPKSLIDDRINNHNLSEQERKQKLENDEKERITKQKKHDAEILSKYGEKYGNKILQHKVCIGMSKEMCRDAGWYPKDTFRTTTSHGVSEVWVINYKTRLYFSNGVLYMIEN